jgi:hypothetical protein
LKVAIIELGKMGGGIRLGKSKLGRF